MIEIDEAEGLEIGFYGMVNDGEGARLVQDHETPDFFDVMVRTTNLDSGMILTLEEHEDLSAEDANVKQAELVETYPLAPISDDDCGLSR